MAHLYERKYAEHPGNDVSEQVDAAGRSYVLVLDEYEMANLKWMLDHIRSKKRFGVLDTGDWLGQIQNAVEFAEIEMSPNGNHRIDEE